MVERCGWKMKALKIFTKHPGQTSAHFLSRAPCVWLVRVDGIFILTWMKTRLCRIDVQSVVLLETLWSLTWCNTENMTYFMKIRHLAWIKSLCFGVSQVFQVLAVLPLSSLLPWRDGMTSLSCLEVLEHLLTLLETSTHRWAITDETIWGFVFFMDSWIVAENEFCDQQKILILTRFVHHDKVHKLTHLMNFV